MAVRVVNTNQLFEFFRDLATDYENSLDPDLRHKDFAADILDLPAAYGPPNAAFVAVFDGIAAGCVALVRLDASTGLVKKLYVRPALRGAGIARKLMGALVDAARSSNIRRLVLDTDKDRLRAAYELYIALGFRECEPYGAVDYATPAFMQLDIR